MAGQKYRVGIRGRLTPGARQRAFEALGAFLVIALALALATHTSGSALRSRGGDVSRCDYDSALDPKEGTTAPPLSGTDEAGRPCQVVPPRDGRPVLVVFLGTCTSCDVGQVADHLRAVALPPYLRTVAISPGSVMQLKYVAGSYKLPFRLLLENPTEARMYNAQWRPRLFLIGRDGRLLYAQPEFIGLRTALSAEVRTRVQLTPRPKDSRDGASR